MDALAAAKGNKLRVGDVTAAFVSANPGLTAPDVQLLLGGKNLEEIHNCYDVDLKFRKCDTAAPADSKGDDSSALSLAVGGIG